MKNKIRDRNLSINIIFTLLFLIMSILFLIYIFRDNLSSEFPFINIPFKEKFETNSLISPYSWKYGSGNKCTGQQLNTNIELQNINSNFRSQKLNRYEDTTGRITTKYNSAALQSSTPYIEYCDIMNYTDLLAYRCLNVSPYTLAERLDEADIKNTVEAIYIYDQLSLFSYLVSKIQLEKNKLNGDKIIGPLYVCISQAPYLKYKNEHRAGGIEKTLDARIDILNNRNPYYYEKINSLGEQTFVTNTSGRDEPSRTVPGANNDITISSLYCHVIIIYPLYKNGDDMIIKNDNNIEQKKIIATFLDTTMATYYTNNELCNIKCNKSTTLNCGCLSYDGINKDTHSTSKNTYFDNATTYTIPVETFDLPKYSARCIDHTTNNLQSNFSMMYYVNPFADRYGDNDLLQEPT